MTDISLKRPHAPTSGDGDQIAAELAWLAHVIDARLKHFFAGEGDAFTLPAPPTLRPSTLLGTLTSAWSAEERLILALALAPQVQPGVLDPFFVRNSALDRPFTEFGGEISTQAHAFRPTIDTALFLLSGTSPTSRLAALPRFAPDHPLRAEGFLKLDDVKPGTAFTATSLSVSQDKLLELATGTPVKPDFSPDFPAQRLQTARDWEDLVLAPEVRDEVEHVLAWIQHEQTILDDWGLRSKLAPGYRALFYGPPGTGKTLTAALLGKRTGLDVYRIDLSMVVSKYIGETEKNLATVFDQAARKHWILFFDEADALFGARTSASSSNDRYANQEVSYLLQRIESCPAVVILATNLKGNIDDAFSRRFQSMVGFTKPNAAQRLKLWRGALTDTARLTPDVDLTRIARDHELVGGAIVNVIRHAAITALRQGEDRISEPDILRAIALELRKEGRTP